MDSGRLSSLSLRTITSVANCSTESRISDFTCNLWGSFMSSTESTGYLEAVEHCGTLTAVFFSMILSYLVDFQSTNRICQLDINWTRSSAGDQNNLPLPRFPPRPRSPAFHCAPALRTVYRRLFLLGHELTKALRETQQKKMPWAMGIKSWPCGWKMHANYVTHLWHHQKIR